MKSFLVIFLLIASCSHKNADFKKRIQDKKCELAVLTIPEFKRTKIKPDLEKYPRATGGYVLRNSNHGVDLTYFVLEGIALPVVACKPVILLGKEQPLDMPAQERCYTKVHDLSRVFGRYGADLNLGVQIYEKSESWKCPDFTRSVMQLEEVSSCYERRGDVDKARDQLLSIIDPRSFGGCLPKYVEREVSDKLINLEKKLRRLK